MAFSGFTDPMVLFTCLCVAVPVLKADSTDEIIQFFREPAVIFTFGVLLATILISIRKAKPVQPWEIRSANWYLMNGTVIHILMDGLVGVFGKVPLIYRQYLVLDRRFQTHDAVPVIAGATELFVMGPLCLLAYYAIYNQQPWRYPLELVIAIFQLFGTIFFAGAEIYNGCVNVPADYPVGAGGAGCFGEPKLEEYYFTFYYFGFWFCNTIWIIVPIRLAWAATCAISERFCEAPTASKSSKKQE
eukprot:m.122891 g.122891  ORF g.122891 m.122891 type:complete len:245 (+) comp23363_c0_seq1:81-815(+)